MSRTEVAEDLCRHNDAYPLSRANQAAAIATLRWTAFGTSLAAALINSLGIGTIRRYADWGQRNNAYFMCFAAGVLIAASFLHMIPKQLSLNPQAPGWLLAGFFGLHLFNRLFTAFVCAKGAARSDVAIGLLPLIGIGFHSFLDGSIYSSAFIVSVLTGYLATIGMVLHEFPEGIVTYLLLVRGGFEPRRAMCLAFAAAAASTLLGMLASWPFAKLVEGPLLGAMLALSAGALMYVGATHLLPRAEQEHRRYSLVALAGGIAVAIVIVMSQG